MKSLEFVFNRQYCLTSTFVFEFTKNAELSSTESESVHTGRSCVKMVYASKKVQFQTFNLFITRCLNY